MSDNFIFTYVCYAKLGIGRDLAIQLAGCGAEVYGVSRTEEHLASLKVVLEW
jgi:short-subunit dehydrogenase